MVAASNFMHKRDSLLLMAPTGSKRKIIPYFKVFEGFHDSGGKIYCNNNYTKFYFIFICVCVCVCVCIHIVFYPWKYYQL